MISEIAWTTSLTLSSQNLNLAGSGSSGSGSDESDVFSDLNPDLNADIAYLLPEEDSICRTESSNSGVSLGDLSTQDPFSMLDIEADTSHWYFADEDLNVATYASRRSSGLRIPLNSSKETANTLPLSGGSIPDSTNSADTPPNYSCASADSILVDNIDDSATRRTKRKRTVKHPVSLEAHDRSFRRRLPSSKASAGLTASSAGQRSIQSSASNDSGPDVSARKSLSPQSMSYRFWTLEETQALVEGVAHCGNGKWAEIKKLSFAAIEKRSPVDLKDKWRNLARLAMLPASEIKPDKKRDAACPPELLRRVREICKSEAVTSSGQCSPESKLNISCGLGEPNSKLSADYPMYNISNPEMFIPNENSYETLLPSALAFERFEMTNQGMQCTAEPALISANSIPVSQNPDPLQENRLPEESFLTKQMVPFKATSRHTQASQPSGSSPTSRKSAETHLESSTITALGKRTIPKKANKKNTKDIGIKGKRGATSQVVSSHWNRVVKNRNMMDPDASKVQNVADKIQSQEVTNYRFWTLEETEALVEGVARCGNGKWAVIKKLSFAAIEKRSPVDLKDKWRNLTRIAILPAAKVKQDKKRDLACPPEILERVREILKMESARNQSSRTSRRRRGQNKNSDCVAAC